MGASLETSTENFPLLVVAAKVIPEQSVQTAAGQGSNFPPTVTVSLVPRPKAIGKRYSRVGIPAGQFSHARSAKIRIERQPRQNLPVKEPGKLPCASRLTRIIA